MAKVKRYRGMTARQLAEETREYEAPGFVPTPVPVHPRVAAAERRVRTALRRRAGRPKVGKGARRVLISIEGGLLSDVDKFAKDHRMSRSEMVASGLRMVMQFKSKSA
jgi:hypothetical protein